VSAEERRKKPKLVRSEPLRSWSTLFDVPRASSESGADAEPSSETPPPLNDVISRSVQLGYQVVDDYLRQGARVARRLSGPTPGPQAFTDEFQELSARSARHFAEMTRIWMDAFRATTGGVAAAPAPAPEASPASPPRTTEAPAGERAGVRIEIRAHQPTEVSLDLHPDAARQALIAHALRAAGARSPRLTDVTFRPATAEAPALLRISIPAGHPAGIYSGLLVDEKTNRPMGTLSVEVGPADEAPAR
jgi:hypothetical protein